MRRRHEFNEEELRKLAQLQCTYEELAGWFGCCRETIKRLMRNKRYRDIYESGKEEGKASLRRRMMAKAMEGNVIMMIFLAKNILGMKDEVKVEHEHKHVDFTALIDHPHVLTIENNVSQPEAVSKAGNGHLPSGEVWPDRSIN